MSYTKPEITALASANFVIQGGQFKMASAQGDFRSLVLATPPAYEADE